MKNKINVNISPNPLDLQTLHCSQNDTGERKFYFTLHNNGEVIDTTDISDPIFEPFDVYKGGTEQLLPVNTDDPTTSPIIADIQYPDEEKTEQEFTYRESPTTIDGKALIEKIKGNTLVWNQLVQNGNFADTSGWTGINGGTISVANNEATVSLGASTTSDVRRNVSMVQNHKYLIISSAKTSGEISISVAGIGRVIYDSSSYETKTNMFTWASASKSWALQIRNQIETENTANVKNIMLFDLTAMFGSTKADEIYAMEQSQSGSGVSYFKSLFPLPYYSYGQKLLSFNGEGIKTTGLNQWDEEWEEGFITPTSGENTPWSGRIRSKNYIPLLQGERYYFNIKNNTSINNIGLVICYYDANKTYISGSWVGNAGNPYESPANASYMRFAMGDGYGSATYNNDICINISSSENGKYEPYQTSTLDIPTSTYFPTGMKSAGSVYDELTNSKAITRIGKADLGTLTWQIQTTATTGKNRFRAIMPTDAKIQASDTANNRSTCSKYALVASGETFVNIDGYTLSVVNGGLFVYIYDSSMASASANDFKTAMDGIYLQYEISEEEVTEFTHASLICEDGESTLYQDVDSLVCDCTEDFSKDSGFKDCKIKFSNDDGVVYSNKIQLHIERKP